MTAPLEPPLAHYRVYRFYRIQILLMFVLFGAVSVVMLASVAAGRSDEPSFVFFWVAAVGWTGYWFLFRFAHELTLTAAHVHWVAPLAKGEVALNDVVRARPMRFAWNVQVIERRDGRPLLVWSTGQLKSFLDQLSEAAPTADVSVGWTVRAAANASERFERLDVSRQRSLLRLLLLVAAAAVVAFCVGMFGSIARSQEILDRSVAVEGEIVRFTNTLRGGHEAIVRYTVKDHVREDETIIQGDAEVGDTVDLRYDPEVPGRVFQEGDDEPPGGEPPLWMPVPFVVGGLSAIGAFRIWRRLRREGG